MLLILNILFRSRDRDLYRRARYNLKSGIREAKTVYTRMIKDHVTNSDPQLVR